MPHRSEIESTFKTLRRCLEALPDSAKKTAALEAFWKATETQTCALRPDIELKIA